MANKLTASYQDRYRGRQFYDKGFRRNLDEDLKLHKEICNPMSSATACINVMGGIASNKHDLIAFFNHFGLGVEDIISFQRGATYGRRTYNDQGNVVFEWVGPLVSPILEVGGSRGHLRTSVDAYILAVIGGTVTQLLIEWKFTEKYNNRDQLQRFAGIAGNERLRRYSSCLARLRKAKAFPFQMVDEGGMGLYDLGYEPFFQLLRFTLLAKLTTPFTFDDGPEVSDYRVIHLSHSKNDALNILSKTHVSCSPGLKDQAGKSMCEVWKHRILNQDEAVKFSHGYWDEALGVVSDSGLKRYLLERYAACE